MISKINPYEVKKEYLQKVDLLKKANENLNGSASSKKEFLRAKKEVEDMVDNVKVTREVFLDSDKSELPTLLTASNSAYTILNNIDTTGWVAIVSEEEAKILSYIA